MSATEINEIKLDLIAWINQLSDVDLLAFLDALKSSKSKGDFWDNLTEDQRKIILKGIDQVNQNKVLNSKQFWESLANA